MADAAAVKAAFAKRKSWTLANVETVTLKSLRKQLEQDLGLAPDALKPHKHLLSDLIDKAIAKADARAEAEAPKKQRAAEAPKEPPRAGARIYTKTVEKMRAICKQATITIPPTLYVRNKSDDELAAALEALLEKHGLSPSAGPNEVARVKQQLQTLRDLDGIDTSNIVEGGRRRRDGEQVSYRKLLEVESDADEDASESSEAGSSEEEEEEGDAASPAAAAVGDGAGKVDPNPSLSPAPAKPAKRNSPDENAGGGKPSGKSPAGTNPPQKRRALANWSDDDE